jgi:hypothetical protein
MLIAAGGICNGRGMAAAFALGAKGIQMGTRFVSAAESPVHANYKQAIIDAGTVMLNRKSHPLLSSYGVKTLHVRAMMMATGSTSWINPTVWPARPPCRHRNRRPSRWDRTREGDRSSGRVLSFYAMAFLC